jgi:hypothetical protein
MGLRPQWRARPVESRRVAAALGFRELGAQLSFKPAWPPENPPRQRVVPASRSSWPACRSLKALRGATPGRRIRARPSNLGEGDLATWTRTRTQAQTRAQNQNQNQNQKQYQTQRQSQAWPRT